MRFVEIEWQSDLYDQEIELRDRLLRAPLGLGFTDEDLQAESNHLHFGILNQQALIACAVIVPLSTNDAKHRKMGAKLRQMAVDVSYQNQGVGSQLIKSIESELRGRQFENIELNAREIAVGFYEKLGYQRQGSQFIEVTLAHWKMIKSIT